jgi:quercetin dioxygenase-like cupin family protein
MAAFDVSLRRFEAPDEVREFENGKIEVVRVGALVLGRATYQPGWKWSVHVGLGLGQKSCPVDHLGLVVSGRAAVLMDDGREIILKPGDLFAVGPGHDSWVVGDEPYVSLHLLGAEAYARK